MAKRKSKKKAKGYLLPKYQEAIVPKNLKTIDSFYDNPAAMGSYLSYPYRTLQNPSYRDIRINPPQYHDPNTIRELHLERRLRPTNITPEMMKTGGKVDLPKYQDEGEVKKISPEVILNLEEFKVREQAYNDSLNLYNASRAEFNTLFNNRLEERVKKSEETVKEMESDPDDEYYQEKLPAFRGYLEDDRKRLKDNQGKDNYGDPERNGFSLGPLASLEYTDERDYYWASGNNDLLMLDKRSGDGIVNKSNISPDYYIQDPRTFDWDGIGAFGHYKKPTQPVVQGTMAVPVAGYKKPPAWVEQNRQIRRMQQYAKPSKHSGRLFTAHQNLEKEGRETRTYNPGDNTGEQKVFPQKQNGGPIQKAQYSDTIYSGLPDIQKKRRKSLLDATDRIVSTQGNDEALRRLLDITAYMESTLGANPEAYGRSYTRGPMSIDNIAYEDLFSYRPKMKNYTKSQKKYFDWLKNEFGYDYKDMDKILRSDDPVAGMAAARMAYGRVPESLPELDDKDKMWDYYLSVYNRGGIDKKSQEHRARFDKGWELLNSSYKPQEPEVEKIPVEEDFSILKYLREKFKDLTGFQNGGEVEQRRGVRENPDGSVSSHLMRAEYIPERGWVGFPSLFQDSKPYTNDSETWDEKSEEEDWMKIYKEAEKRGEVYDFGNDKEAALKFGEGSWKDSDVEMQNGGEVVVPMQQELPHQEIVSFPTEREPYVDPKIPMWANKDYYKNIYNTNVRESLAKQYSIWKSIFKSPDGINIEGYKNIYDIQEFFNSGEWRKGFKNVEKYRKPSHPMLGKIDPETLTFMPSERNVNTNEEIADYILQENIPVNFKKVERIPINPDGFAPGSATEFADKVVIPSGNITMKDMQEPILANGEMLMPGDEAQFDTDYVVEEKLPKAQDGLKVEGQKLSKKEVDDLKNFVEDDTNFVQEYPYLLPEAVIEDKLDRTNRTAVRNWSREHDPIAYAAREATDEAAPYVGTGLGVAFAPAGASLLGAGARGLAAAGEATYGALSPYASAAWNASIPGMSSVPGATVGNLFNAGFGTHGATNIAPDALELLTNPLSLENLANVGIDALEMAPMYGPMSKMLGELGTTGRVGKSSKPTSAAAIEGVLPTIKQPNKNYKPTKAELDAYGITQAEFDAPTFKAIEKKFFKTPEEYLSNKADNTSKWKMYKNQKNNIDELEKYDKIDYESEMDVIKAEYLNLQNEAYFKRLNSLEKEKAMEKYLYELEMLSEKMDHKADLKLIVENDKFKKYEPVGILENYAEATGYNVNVDDPKSIEAFKAWQKNQMPSLPKEILLDIKPGKFPFKNEKLIDSKGIIQETSPMGGSYRFDDKVGGRLPELMEKHKASFEAKFGTKYDQQDLGLYAKLQEIENLDRYRTSSFNRFKTLSDKFIETQNITKEYTTKEELLLNIYTRGYDRKINRRASSASEKVLKDFYEKHIAEDMEKLIKKKIN